MIQELCEWMVSSGELDNLVIGETLFAGVVPDTLPTSALYSVVLERAGTTTDPYLQTARQKAIQLFTRGGTYFTARDEASRIFEWLLVKKGIQLSGWYIYSVSGNEPQYIGYSPLAEHEFSANVIIQVRKE